MHPIDDIWLAKIAGALCGVIISMVMIAPESNKNAFYRLGLGSAGGIIFSPITMNVLPFFRGDGGMEYHLAAACLTGFACWFILEGIARLLASDKYIARLLEEVLRLKRPDDEQ